MHVTTFYSFKGGVGRTMALVNTAVELANRGRRVVAVDFDLEAPGLDSFGILRPDKPGPGLVDFVHQYLETGASPDAREFMYRAPNVGDKGGQLWIMPAGAGRKDYQARFRELDWMELYDRYDGYLLFEDLKAQWEKTLKADWVVVDSRTGHTDTGGICTRQLPDAVVVVFFPNEQNLRGLKSVIREIRAEADTARKKRIELHFVMSNVPDLDDEDEILMRQIQSFRDGLSMEQDPAIVHRYDSLALLNQSVFVQERPKSRLANEYRALTQVLIHANLRDRDGALFQLRELRESLRNRPASFRSLNSAQDVAVREMEAAHDQDAEVLWGIAKVRAVLDSGKAPTARTEAERLVDKAIAAGSRDPEAFLFRGRSRERHGDAGGAKEDAMRVLSSDSVHAVHVLEAARMASLPRKAIRKTVAGRSFSDVDLILAELR